MWSPSCRQKYLNTWKWQVIVLFLKKKKKTGLFSCFCVFHQFRNNSWDGYKWPRCHYMLGVSSSHPITGWYTHPFLQGNVNPIWAEVFYTKGGCCKCPDRGPTDLLAEEPRRVSCKLYAKESNDKKRGVFYDSIMAMQTAMVSKLLIQWKLWGYRESNKALSFPHI